jgi:hypothetical protein
VVAAAVVRVVGMFPPAQQGSRGFVPVDIHTATRQCRDCGAFLLLVLELGVLLAVVIMQMFLDWDNWLSYNQGQLLAVHVVGVGLAVWHGTFVVESVKENVTRRALVLYRTCVLALDTMVLARAARAVHNDGHAANVAQMCLVAALVAVSLLRVYLTTEHAFQTYSPRRNYTSLSTTPPVEPGTNGYSDFQ